MSKASLKKIFRSMDSEELSDLLLSIYSSVKEAKTYLDFWENPDVGELVESMKLKIRKIYFIRDDKPRKSPSASDYKNLLKTFGILCQDSESMAELRVYDLECRIDWLATRNRYASKEKSTRAELESVREFVESSGLSDRFGIKLERCGELIDSLFSPEMLDLKRRKTGRFFRWRKY